MKYFTIIRFINPKIFLIYREYVSQKYMCVIFDKKIPVFNGMERDGVV